MNTSEPIPAANSPGSKMTGRIAPPNPAASMMITAPTMGEPKREDIAAKLAAAAIRATTWSGASLRAARTARIASPPASAISGASGPRTIPKPMEASEASRTPGSSIGWVGGPALRPSAGLWPPLPGQASDGEGDRHRRNGQDGQRPPRGDGCQAEPAREILVEPFLEVVDQLEISPRGQGHHHADHCRKHKEYPVVLAAKQGAGIGWRGSYLPRRDLPSVRIRCSPRPPSVLRPPCSGDSGRIIQIPLSAAMVPDAIAARRASIVTLVLVGVRAGEVGQCLVEHVTRAEIGANGRGAAGPCVGTSQCPGADTGIDLQGSRGPSFQRRPTPSSPTAGAHRSPDGCRPAARVVAIPRRCHSTPA